MRRTWSSSTSTPDQNGRSSPARCPRRASRPSPPRWRSRRPRAASGRCCWSATCAGRALAARLGGCAAAGPDRLPRRPMPRPGDVLQALEAHQPADAERQQRHRAELTAVRRRHGRARRRRSPPSCWARSAFRNLLAEVARGLRHRHPRHEPAAAGRGHAGDPADVDSVVLCVRASARRRAIRRRRRRPRLDHFPPRPTGLVVTGDAAARREHVRLRTGTRTATTAHHDPAGVA